MNPISQWLSANKTLAMALSALAMLAIATAAMWKVADMLARGGRAVGTIETTREGVSDADKAGQGMAAVDACHRAGRMWDLRRGTCRDRPAAGVPQPE